MRKISRILFSWYVYQRTAYFVPAAQAHLPMGNATDQGKCALISRETDFSHYTDNLTEIRTHLKKQTGRFPFDHLLLLITSLVRELGRTG